MFEIINNYNKEIKELDILQGYVYFVVKEEHLENCLFNIILIDNKEIKEINSKYRNIDRETDVITFALEDYKDKEKGMDFRVLGDIYISIDKTYEQAELYGHSVKRELCFLATHGILHLLGYDHMIEEEEKIMFKRQEELLNAYEIQR